MPSAIHSFLRKWRRGRAHADSPRPESESSTTSLSKDRMPPLSASKTDIAPGPKKGELGLVLLDRKDAKLDGNDRFSVDIVFVHGLNGDITGTWTHSNGTCWPRDLLPDAIPGARIFLYGYDSKIFSPSTSHYRDFALGLMGELYRLERITGSARPTIFVCHSLGGIVVKEALNVAADRDWSQLVLDRTKGIVFLGTPHRGSDAAGTARLLSNILEAVWTPVGFALPAPRTKLVHDLERSSKELFAISDRFIGKANAIQIATLYESDQMFPLRKVVVDENSAVLGLPHERRWPMYTNHCDLCRFDNERSRDYQTVVDAIHEMIASIVPSRAESESERSLTNSEQTCMQQLATVDIAEFESQIAQRLPDTLSWLLEDVHYNQWLSKTSIRLLLVTGYAGCGKTVLSSFLRSTLSSHAMPASLICRFYCDAKEAELSSALGLMRSMIHQTIQHSHQALRTTVKAAKNDQWLWGSFERLWTLFERITTSNGIERIIIIIDAVDELEDKTQRQISAKILHLLEFGTISTVKFVITSQPHAFAARELERHSTHLALETKQDVIGEDVNLYIHDRLTKLQMRKGWSDTTRQRLTEVLQSKADRSFLWVSFTLSFLEHRDILDKMDLEAALSQIPPDLTKFYQRFLTSIASRDAPGPALRLLNMILSSSRPLHMDELAILLSINSSHKSVTEVQLDYTVKGIQSIQQALGPLVKLHNSRIQLVHTSLRDHLREFGGQFGVDESKGHELLAERCILYLLLQHYRQNSIETVSTTSVVSPTLSLPGGDSEHTEDVSSENLESVFGTIFEEPEALDGSGTRYSGPGNELYAYAIRFWATYLEQCHPPEGSSLHALAIELYTQVSQSRWTEYLRIATGEPYDYPTRPDALTIASFYGHETLLRHFLIDPHISDANIGEAFYWASARGHANCVRTIHSHMRPSFDKSLCTVSGRSALAVAAENGHIENLQFLLNSFSIDLNQRDQGGQTALSLAAQRAQDQVVGKLLAMERSDELDVNVQDNKGRSALFWACSANSADIVSRLLKDDRTHPNLLDSHGCDALSWACQDGLANIVKLFVDNPLVVLSNQDEKGNTPLIYAVKSKDFHTVTAFFRRHRRNMTSDAAADLNIAAKDREGRNAISWAASNGDSRILEYLLRHCSSEANIQDTNGWPPLAWTMDPPGFPQNTIKLLPYCGDRINDRDYLDSSLLSTAISWRQFEIARILLERTDIDVNSRNEAGRTALSFAASAGSLEIVKILLDIRNADPLIADNAGNLPLNWARGQRYIEIVDCLENVAIVGAGTQNDL